MPWTRHTWTRSEKRVPEGGGVRVEVRYDAEGLAIVRNRSWLNPGKWALFCVLPDGGLLAGPEFVGTQDECMGFAERLPLNY